MLYPTLRLVSGVALRWYYRDVTIRGADRIPATAPVLLTVNHPNALVDALVVGWVVKRRVRITAKAVLFENPVLAAFLRVVGVVPLRRASDERARQRTGAQDSAAAPPADPARNADAFRSIVDSLDAGHAVLIFPEGKSHDAPTLEPLKTGPARMALAAREAGRAPGLKIVPMGLVFEAKDTLRSRVLAVVGEPIDVHAWTSPEGASRDAEVLTAEIDRRLREVILTAPSHERLAEVQALAGRVTEILANDAIPVGGRRSLGDEFAVATRIARGLETLERLPPGLRGRAERLLGRITAFANDLAAAGVAWSDVAISLRVRHGARFAVRELALLIVAGPVALWGRVNHWLPFRLARRIALHDVSSRDQPAMRTIVAGLGLVLASYAVQAGAVWFFTSGWMAAAYLVTLPFAADIDLRYTDRVRDALRRMRTWLRLRSNREAATALSSERAALAEEIRALDRALGQDA